MYPQRLRVAAVYSPLPARDPFDSPLIRCPYERSGCRDKSKQCVVPRRPHGKRSLRVGALRSRLEIADRASATLGHALGLLEYNPRIVGVQRAGAVTSVIDCRIGPDWDARAVVAACLVAHDVAPLGPIHVTVAIGERGCILIERPIVAGTNDMPDFMGHGIRQRRTRMVNDDK